MDIIKKSAAYIAHWLFGVAILCAIGLVAGYILYYVI